MPKNRWETIGNGEISVFIKGVGRTVVTLEDKPLIFYFGTAYLKITGKESVATIFWKIESFSPKHKVLIIRKKAC
ncbi:MAG: hypothetical protein KKH79_10360 [Candidatus Thermoplasmatota archaeon]|nr:hypothetical protein [Candidatus Thermoplasmatota archaeon]